MDTKISETQFKRTIEQELIYNIDDLLLDKANLEKELERIKTLIADAKKVGVEK